MEVSARALDAHPRRTSPEVAEGVATYRARHFRFACAHVGATVLLLMAGGLVTSKDAGLAVPDWPTSFGNWWFVRMQGGVLFEHGHRLVAQFVGLLTVIHAWWMWKRESRPWLRKLGVALLITVIAQGVLGGITVLTKLPPAVSVAHGTLAQLFLCMSIAVAYFLSREWIGGAQPTSADAVRLRRGAALTFGVILCQLVLGASVRHTGSALAIPDFPLALGRVIPPLGDPHVAVHFAHRVFAGVVLVTILWYVARVMRSRLVMGPAGSRLALPAAALGTLVFVQIGLGATAVWTRTRWDFATLHQFTGALLLGTAALLVLRSLRLPEGEATP